MHTPFSCIGDEENKAEMDASLSLCVVCNWQNLHFCTLPQIRYLLYRFRYLIYFPSKAFTFYHSTTNSPLESLHNTPTEMKRLAFSPLPSFFCFFFQPQTFEIFEYLKYWSPMGGCSPVAKKIEKSRGQGRGKMQMLLLRLHCFFDFVSIYYFTTTLVLFTVYFCLFAFLGFFVSTWFCQPAYSSACDGHTQPPFDASLTLGGEYQDSPGGKVQCRLLFHLPIAPSPQGH